MNSPPILDANTDGPGIMFENFSRSSATYALSLPLTTETHEKALAIAERHQLNIYDANIWAAAILAGCDTLYSEDMHAGLMIEGTTLQNPFLV